VTGSRQSFEDFVRPLVGDTPPPAGTPLNELPAGDYAVLAWLDDVQARCPADVEAEIVARWGSATLQDVYVMVTDADESGARSS